MKKIFVYRAIRILSVSVLSAALTACGGIDPAPDMYESDEPTVLVAESNDSDEEFAMTIPPSIVAGTYKQTITENLGGQNYVFNYYITLKEDHTGVMSIQDDVKITWDDKKITYLDDPDTSYNYTLEGGVLTIDMNGVDSVFKKQAQEKK